MLFLGAVTLNKVHHQSLQSMNSSNTTWVIGLNFGKFIARSSIGDGLYFLLKIRLGGFQGLICAKSWGFREADIACRERDYDGAVAAARIVLPDNVSFTPHTGNELFQLQFNGTVWLKEVSCSKDESSLRVTIKCRLSSALCVLSVGDSDISLTVHS